jgi:hypothetical protein
MAATRGRPRLVAASTRATPIKPYQPPRWLRFTGRLPSLSVAAGGVYLPDLAGVANGLVNYHGDILGTPSTGRRWWVTHADCGVGSLIGATVDGQVNPVAMTSLPAVSIPQTSYPCFLNAFSVEIWPQQNNVLGFPIGWLEDFSIAGIMQLDQPVYLIEGEYLATYLHVRNDSAQTYTFAPRYRIQVLEEDLDANSTYIGS